MIRFLSPTLIFVAVAMHPAYAFECEASIDASDLVKQHFNLSYVTLGMQESATAESADVDAFYFKRDTCECSVAAPDGASFSKAEVSAAVSGKAGLARLVARLAGKSGVCPPVMTNSPTFHCFDGTAKLCKEAAAR
ncbi:hypothetical protein [Mesorhizobium mediterraneum]|uniref:hypothetical protein n=1 Tax=Mesorhizobium mediterraneum TaxID=43617 RepID=UPI001781585B|nr:hypothetical protein [Mesorhizobium mediterraneum]